MGDIFRLYYPQRAVYAEALRYGHLPLWTPDVLAGFPLLAEGQTGVFYPLNLLLYRFLPVDLALNYSILIALSLAGVMMYALGRALRLRPAAAFLAALVFAYSGFLVGHFNHLNIMGAASWLPLQLALIERGTGVSPGVGKLKLVVVLGVTVGLQFLAGHPQIWLMSVLVVLAFGLFRSLWPATGARRPAAQAVRLFASVVAAVLVGIALAAVQLLPTWELVRDSVRAGGLAPDFFTSFSWHPALLATLIVPFILGNPYPNVSVELAAYLGVLPLGLALVAIILQRDRLSAFLVGLAGVSLWLAFGDYTPLYASLARVPVLNLFRVPARFLYPFTLAVAVLAGRGLDALLSRGDRNTDGPGRVKVALVVGGVALGAVAARMMSLEELLALRWVLPALITVLAGGVIGLAWQQRMAPRTLTWVAISLTLIDLYAFGMVYRRTYNDLMPLDEFYAMPASLTFFPEDIRDYRTLTHEAIVPALSVMRASLYPNVSLVYGIPSANGYFPLMPARHARYLADLSPGRLNLLNARYFLIPQLLPVDPETERYDLYNPFTPELVGKPVDVPPTQTEAVELISFTSQSADWPQGELVADIVLTGRNGVTVTLPVRAGQETAEWAYDRSDVVQQITHDRPPIARTWPAQSGFPPEDHPGHAYRARYRLPKPVEVTRIQVVPTKPAGLFHIEELTLMGAGRRRTVAELLGMGRHELAYRDPDVVIYRNLDALPRAFVTYRARVVPDDETALSIIDDPTFDPRDEVLLAGEDKLTSSAPPSTVGERVSKVQIVRYTSRQVEVEVELDQPGYLVLLDSYYPGWRVTVDGRPATIQRANVLFRAVALDAGRHMVTFVYDPLTLKVGAAISLMALAGLAAVTLRISLIDRPASL